MHNLFESIFMPDYTGLCERFESRPGWPCRHPLQQLPQEVSSPPSWKSVYKMLVLLLVPALWGWGQLRVSVTPWNYQKSLGEQACLHVPLCLFPIIQIKCGSGFSK